MKVSPEILQMTPYRPGKPIAETQREYGIEKVIKLASNENPLGVSPLALEAVKKTLSELHYYPDPSAYELIQVLTQSWSVSQKQLSIGNGSDEIIDLLTRIYCLPGEGVLTSEVAFQAYEVSSAANRLQLYKTPLTSDSRFDLEAMAQFFLNHPEKNIKLIFIANPNNPTGTYVSRREMKNFFDKLGGRDDVLLVFDEAYTEFLRAEDAVSAMDYLTKVSNLVILRTFSKAYGLAGLRLGVLVAQPEVIEIYNRVRKPFNVNTLAQVAAAAAIKDDVFIGRSQRLVWESLDYFYEELDRLKLPYLKSQGNFVLFDTQKNALSVYEDLLRKGLILRPVVNYGLKTHLRMSVGLPEENETAIELIASVLSR